jgi:hypothetical protein
VVDSAGTPPAISDDPPVLAEVRASRRSAPSGFGLDLGLRAGGLGIYRRLVTCLRLRPVGGHLAFDRIHRVG